MPQLTNEQWVEKAKTAKDAGFLWKVEGQNQVSWLYGTIHVNTIELAMPSPQIVSAIKGVDTVVLELDLSTPEKAKILASELTKSTSGTQPNVGTKPLDEKIVARIKKYAEALCLSADVFLKLPVAVMQAALPIQALRSEGLYPELMVDAFIGGIGTRLKKKVVALESAQSQVAALEGDISILSTDAAFEETLRGLETGAAQKVMRQVFDAWSQGDLAKLEQFSQWCECMRTPAEKTQMKRLNDDRNIEMAKQIVQMLGSGQRLFVAVGALHMMGSKSLPVLLREQGLTVTYIPLKPQVKP